jgi:hypothetical protein
MAVYPSYSLPHPLMTSLDRNKILFSGVFSPTKSNVSHSVSGDASWSYLNQGLAHSHKPRPKTSNVAASPTLGVPTWTRAGAHFIQTRSSRRQVQLKNCAIFDLQSTRIRSIRLDSIHQTPKISREVQDHTKSS